MEVIPNSTSKEDFISGMAEKGWSVKWEDKRKHIVFENENGDKVRDSKIEKTFAGLKVNKEDLTIEFERQNELRLRNTDNPELGNNTDESEYFERYFAEVESAIAGISGGCAGGSNSEAGIGDRVSEESGTDTLIRKVEADINASRNQRGVIVHSEAESRARERERRLEEQRRAREQERAAEISRRSRRRSEPSR